jgi:hypothetical protein
MTDQWRVRIRFLYDQALYYHFFLPVGATVEDVIVRCYEYANSIRFNLKD